MSKLKLIFKNLNYNPFSVLLIITQVTIALIIIYIFLGSNAYFFNSLKTSNKIFNNNIAYMLSPVGQSSDIANNTLDEFTQFYKFMNSSTDFHMCKYNYDSLFIKPFTNYKDFIISNYKKNIDNINYYPIKQFCIDKSFLENFDLKIDKGRFFSNDEFNHQSDCIILGNNYKKVFDLNDEIIALDTFNNIKKFKIIGFLKKGERFIKNINVSNIKNLDNIAILPIIYNYPLNEPIIDENLQKVKFYQSIFNGCFFIDNLNNKDFILKNIKSEAKKYNFIINIDNLNNNTELFKYENKPLIISLFLISIISIFFIVISLISSLLIYIRKNYIIIGIHLINGAKLKDILFLFSCRLLLITFISFFLSIYFINFYFNSSPILALNVVLLLQLIFILIIINFLILSISITKIRKLQINNLIRRL